MKAKKYRCDICEKHFTQKEDLRRHKDSVHEDKKYRCDICDKQFTQTDGLRRHNHSVHEGNKYTCMCKAIYTKGLSKNTQRQCS